MSKLIQNIREQVAIEIRTIAADLSAHDRPLRPDAQTPTDFANDFEWAAMIAEGTFAIDFGKIHSGEVSVSGSVGEEDHDI